MKTKIKLFKILLDSCTVANFITDYLVLKNNKDKIHTVISVTMNR